MKRYFEFQDSKSYKFWQIEVEQANCTVKYGKIGTAGQEKVTTFDSEEKAQKEMAKLVAEKTKKGYVEKTQASEKKTSKRITVDYDEADEGKTLLGKVQAFVESAQAAETQSLVIGCWEEPYESDGALQSALDYLCDNSSRLPNLKELFVGDMDSEECEISWIIQGDYTRVFAAFPALERLHIKGSSALTLSSAPLAHASLKSLTIECGGLQKKQVQTIIAAQLPNLEELLLYLGVDDYGCDTTLDDLRPLMEKGRFPKLKSLGLTDSEYQDEIAQAIAEASILDQLETLNLSMGTLRNVGGEALLASSKLLQLKRLDLHYHFMGDAMIKRFKALPIIVDVSNAQDPEDDWVYPEVTE